MIICVHPLDIVILIFFKSVAIDTVNFINPLELKMTKRFSDDYNEFVFPEEFTFTNGETVSTDDIRIQPVRDEEENRILAFNVSTDLEGAGTVSNHLIVQPFNEIQVGLGRYDEDPDEYEHPDDSSYDTVEYVSDETTAQIEINDIEAFDEDY